jgi:hypothetical protein
MLVEVGVVVWVIPEVVEQVEQVVVEQVELLTLVIHYQELQIPVVEVEVEVDMEFQVLQVQETLAATVVPVSSSSPTNHKYLKTQ